ncbi:hypothetical protein RR48_10263 [Papilio machaon]|uniref:Uncharacterized protein n=1 Tax=Papilio machaon TaxID=76193 RepID=A0A194RGU6_PAPMA|nr:hypothetical protein RR48_10263 [Papilio machaon]
MVNLPAISLRNVRDDDRERLRTRSHHTWGMRLGRSRDEVKWQSEPTGLHQLEKLARRSLRLMEKHGTNTPDSYVQVMDLLRQQYNMNFMVLCEKCSGPHNQDELLAPER